MKKGDPGLETWANLDAARHGGGKVWIPGSYDPETHLYIFGTGNPTPAYTAGRREGDNLYTCSLVAINIDTGKMAWYYQTSPHDTHDWDSTETPVLIDGEFNGKPRKLVLHAERNGYFFILDRVTGEHLVTTKFSDAANWAKGINAKGQPVRDPDKDSTVAGSLVSPNNGGADQLAASHLLSGYGPVLCPRARSLRHVLSDRNRSSRRHGTGRQGRGSARLAGQLSDRHRLQDRQGRLAARYPGTGGIGAATAC